MTFLAFDDTDSIEGMCTSYLMARFILEAVERGMDIIGYPALVRLNPNIPYKTRGNGALRVRIGNGTGKKILITRWQGQDIHAYTECEIDSDMGTEAFKLACDLVEEKAEMNAEGTDPGVVIFTSQPDRGFYLKALHGLIGIKEAEDFITSRNGRSRKFKSGRGIIGAAAACAWTPIDRTFEIVAYRHPDRFGLPRGIDKESVIAMDHSFPNTFNNYDYRNRYIAITPSSPCPVLFGIRGEKAEELVKASGMIRGEGPQGFVIFETNQDTDEHLIEKRIRDVIPYESVILQGQVREKPRNLLGGHVVFSIADSQSEMECTAYEPTKEFRGIVRALVPKDEVRVCGGVRKEPFTINLEKIEVLNLVERRRKVSNPTCEDCGIGMKSIGRGQGFRCRRCGRKANEAEAVYEVVEPKISKGWYEVPICARRHLSKPLKRMAIVSEGFS
ncbi:MAG: DUF1743 domain-containing protein [Thermoplasmata archaeon]|nr:DUF1743 domain-containing protein [Thermoplasmata archaeon]